MKKFPSLDLFKKLLKNLPKDYLKDPLEKLLRGSVGKFLEESLAGRIFERFHKEISGVMPAETRRVILKGIQGTFSKWNIRKKILEESVEKFSKEYFKNFLMLMKLFFDESPEHFLPIYLEECLKQILEKKY